MEIKHATSSNAKIRNVYKIDIETYFGDADGDSNITITVKPEKIKQVVAEIMFIRSQFRGRGGCSEMYDQMNYFSMSEADWDANDGKHDGYWEWFDRENGDYPYYVDGEQNYTLRGYKIHWYDDSGAKFAATVHDVKELQDDINQLNAKHRIDNWDVWNPDTDSDDAMDDLEPLFAAYRLDAIEILKKHCG